MDVREYNRRAWNRAAQQRERWSTPVSRAAISRARAGDFDLILTPKKPVPRSWLPQSLTNIDVLGLASAGGQQMPLFAAAGAQVVSFDNSPEQLALDRDVAERERLDLATVEGDMRDLRAFEDRSFDVVFHPVSNCFVESILEVWKEAFRVLRPGGRLLSGVSNPLIFCFDPKEVDHGRLVMRYSTPYSDIESLTEEERRRYIDAGEPLCFGHSLQDQLGGQLAAGFVLEGLYEDAHDGDPEADLIAQFFPGFVATLARKPTFDSTE